MHDSQLSSAFNLSSRHREAKVAEGQRAEAEHMLNPEYRSAHNFSMDEAGPSRRKERTAGGILGGSALKATSSLSNFKGPGKKSQLSGVYVDAEGRVHDTEFDPFAAVAEVTRNRSRRRSAFGSERKRGSDSDSTASEDSIDKSGAGPGSDGYPNEDLNYQRRESERRQLEAVSSGQAMMRRRSVLSQRSGEGRMTPSLPSLRSTDEQPMSAIQHYHLDRLSRSKPGQSYGSNHRSPLSPTFGHSPSNFLPPVADSDERPVKSTEITSTSSSKAMRPPPVPKSKVEIKAGGTKKITGFDAPESPMPQQTQQTPRQTPRPGSHLVLSPGRVSSSSRASRVSSETQTESRMRPAERPREETFPETPAQAKKREDRQRKQANLGFNRASTSRLPLDVRASSSAGARVLPEIEILADDDPRVVIPADGPSTRVQTKYTQADHVIRPFASSSILDRPSSLRSGMAGSGTKAPSEILDEGHGGYVPTRWAKGDKLLRVTEDEKEKYRPKEWGGKTGDLAGKPEEWRSVLLFLSLEHYTDVPDQRLKKSSRRNGKISRRMRNLDCLKLARSYRERLICD